LDRGGKEKLVKELHETLSTAQLVVRVGFAGLTVEQINSLRREMEKVRGTTLAVIKNTLAEIASRGTPTHALFEKLTGANAFVISEEEVAAPAKVLTAFAKTNQKLVIRDGVVGGQFASDAQVKALADLPSREQLLAKLLYVFNAPAANFVKVCAAVPRGLLNVLNARKEELSKAA
jgi:large subunit ribosomal protein L10